MTQKHVLLPRAERAARRPTGPYDYPVVTVGQMVHVSVVCATALGAQGLVCARQVLAAAEADYLRLAALFGNVNLGQVTVIIAPLSPSSDGTGGAYHYGCAATDLYCDADFSDARRTSALFLAELSEVGQAVQSKGWDCGATNGEGLSRVHAEALYPGVLDDYESASAWLDSARPNWVDKNEPTDQDPVSNGCAVLFLNWLLFKGYSLAKVTQVGGSFLSALYSLLTGKGTAFADFSADVAARWPAGKPSNITTDNPWGAAPPPPPPPPPPPAGKVKSAVLTFADGSTQTLT